MEKRNTRTYKTKDKPYFKAKKRAKGKLATMIEDWVAQYARGFEVGTITPHNTKEKP